MKKILTIISIAICFSQIASAQFWNTTGNTGTTAGTNFIGTTDAKDFVFKTGNTEKGRVKVNGQWQFGATTNLAKIDSGGNLSFSGNAAYKVAGNKYAFQYSGNPNYGLFFNSQSLLYEFRTSTALSIFSIGANSGNGIFKGNLKVGAYTLPATDGTTGQVLKTDGAGILAWSADNNSGGGSQWTTNGTAVYYNTGNVGIGTSTPGVLFNVVSTTSSNPVSFDGAAGMFISLYEGGAYRGYLGSFSGAATDVDFGTGGGNTTGKLNFTIQATPKMTIDASGNVGIGTTSPVAKLHVSLANATIPTAEFVNTSMGPNISWINFGSTGDWYIRSSSNSGKVILQDQSTSAPVCIGTSQVASGYKLNVDGKIICEEVKVQNSVSWPDYVFESSYKLPDLLSVEKQIQAKGHLPGVPSADEVCNNGISLGEMQATLLQKVEELTLYMIEQQKQINALKTENEELKISLQTISK